MDNFLSLLQFSDGLFPAGAYAHSFGLESYVQSGGVTDAAGVEDFLARVSGRLGGAHRSGGGAVRAESGNGGDLAACIALDETLDAMKAASELRDASRQMGRQTLRVANHFASHALLSEFGEAVAAELSPVPSRDRFRNDRSRNAVARREMASAYLYSTSAAMVGAALRLLPLGQLAGQRILWNIRPLIAQLAEEAQGKGRDDMWSFAPALEIASMRHATLEARLFRS